MTDSLRTRIAAALMRDAFGLTTQSAALRQADAVIRELGLRPEWGHLNHEDSGRLYDTLKEAHTHQALRGETLRTRLISDWTDVPAG